MVQIFYIENSMLNLMKATRNMLNHKDYNATLLPNQNFSKNFTQFKTYQENNKTETVRTAFNLKHNVY